MPLSGSDASQVDEAAQAAADSAAAAAQSASDATAASAAAVAAKALAEAARNAAIAAQSDVAANAAQATVAANQAVSVSAAAGSYPNAAGSNVPRGLTQASVGAITAGSGGTNGTFALGFSGGTGWLYYPTGTFTVAAGIVTAVAITAPGLCISATPVVPTVSFAASAGLTGAAVALTAQYLATAGYWATSADGSMLDFYRNVAGVATRDSSVASLPASSLLTSMEIITGTLPTGIVSTSSGSTTYDASTVAGATPEYAWGSAVPTSTSGLLSSVSVRLDDFGTGYLHVYVPNRSASSADAFKYRLDQLIAVTAPVAGVNTFNLNVFVEKGSYILYQRVTGGRPRRDSGAATTYIYVANASQVLNALSTIQTDTGGLSLSYTVRSIDTLKDQIETAQALADVASGVSLTASATTTVGDAAFAVSTQSVNGVAACSGPTLTRGRLGSISVSIHIAGPSPSFGRIAVYTPNGDSTYTLKYCITQMGVVDGVNTFDLTWRNIVLPKGSFVGWIGHATARLNASADGAGYGTDFFDATGNYTEESVATIFASRAFKNGVSFTMTTLTDDGMSDRIADNMNAYVASNVIYARTDFPGVTTPRGWTLTGAWTVSDGMSSPGSGGWTTTALAPGYSSTANRKLRTRVTVTDITSVFGICTAPIETNSGSAVAMVNGTTGKLGLYLWDGSTAGTLITDTALPAALVSGRDYVIEVKKTGYINDLTFTDTVTQQTATLSYSSDVTYAQFHGRPGVIFISGNIKVQRFDVQALYKRTCRAIIIGDSICERSSGISVNGTWAFQLAAMRTQGDIIVSARSGDETPNFMLRKPLDLDAWLPQYVVIALGTNDTDQAVWRGNMKAIIATVEAIGAIPVLCTQVPRTASQALRTAMNIDIRTGYFGRYRYIDMAVAVSNAHDGVTWDAAYDSGDGIHPNTAGQTKMYQQALIDAPALVD